MRECHSPWYGGVEKKTTSGPERTLVFSFCLPAHVLMALTSVVSTNAAKVALSARHSSLDSDSVADGDILHASADLFHDTSTFVTCSCDISHDHRVANTAMLQHSEAAASACRRRTSGRQTAEPDESGHLRYRQVSKGS